MEQPAALCGFSLWLAPLGFPRGEAAGIDGTSEPASPADEGWRELESSKIPVEWHKTETNAIYPAAFMNKPVAAPHQSRQNIGSEMPIFHRDSFPPGEAKNSEDFGEYHTSKHSVAWKAAAPLGSPSWRPLQGNCKTVSEWYRTGWAENQRIGTGLEAALPPKK